MWYYVMQSSLKLLVKYLYDCQVKALAHGTAEAINRKRERICTWSQSILSLVVGVTSVSTWNNASNGQTKSSVPLIAVGVVLSFVSAGIGATRSAFRYANKESEHKTCSVCFADIASDVELFLSRPHTQDEIERFADQIHERLDVHLTAEVPISPKYIQQAHEQIGEPRNGIFDPVSNGIVGNYTIVEVEKKTNGTHSEESVGKPETN